MLTCDVNLEGKQATFAKVTVLKIIRGICLWSSLHKHK